MKNMTIRNYALGKEKRQAFYQGKEIIDCGLLGRPRYYWIQVLDESKSIHPETIHLYMAEVIQVV